MELDGLQIRCAVVEDELRCKRKETRRLGCKLKGHQRERLAWHQAKRRERSKRVRRIFQHLIQHGGIRAIGQRHRLVDGLARRARREVDFACAHLDHGDEWLAARRKRVAAHPQAHADWWIHFLYCEVDVLAFFQCAEQGLIHALLLVAGGECVSEQLFGFELVPVKQVHEALCNLEEVRVWLMRREVDREHLFTVRRNLHLRWADLEWIRKFLACQFIGNRKKGPVHLHRKNELVVQRNLS